MADATNQFGEQKSWGGRLITSMFEYQTLKIVNIGNKKIGLLNRILQLTILGYVFGYVIIYQKGYQQFSQYNAATTTKIKGIISTRNLNNDSFLSNTTHIEHYIRVWDVTDIVVPASEADGFFLTTNLILTEQHLGRCAEDPTTPKVECKFKKDCKKGQVDMLGNGVQTGECTEAGSPYGEMKVCEIDGWCPFEVDRGPLKNKKPLFEGIVDFTVLLKNYVEFPLFNQKLRNIRDTTDSSYLTSCKYDPVNHPQCPVFRIGDILTLAGIAPEDIALKGGVIRIVVKWDCDFDYDVKYCLPTYQFLRIDDPKAQLSPGWNFRYDTKYSNGTRTLHKAYGITFRISTQARAGQFYFVNVAINIGSGLGLLAMTTVICDLVVLHCVRKRDVYKRNKFRFVDDTTDDCEDSINYGR